MEKKKIVMMYDFFSEHGGVERIMLFQAKALKKAGYDVSFAFAYVDEKLKRERLQGFKVIEYGKLSIKNETLQISSSILRNNFVEKFKDFDLIICHSFPSSYLALRIKKRFKIPYILHLHHPPQFLYNADLDWAKNSLKRKVSFIIGKILRKNLRKFDFYCVKNADAYFAECETVKRILNEVYNIESVVIYPTVDNVFKIKKVQLEALQKLGIEKDYILGSGRIIKQKRFDYLVKAFSKLKNKNLQLVLAGKYEEDMKKQLDVVAKHYNVNILFLGPLELPDLIKVYNLAKVTVLTCPKEWFGLVPIEAMACGCPVVSWKDNFGPQETIIENKSGFLAEPYNVNDFSVKINKALNKKWIKKEIRKTVDKFSEKEIGRNLVREVEKII